MKVTKTRQGFSDYIVIEKELMDTYEENAILSNEIPSLLPCELRCEEGKESYYFLLDGCEEGNIWMKDESLREFFFQLILCFENLQLHLLDLDHMILSLDYIFKKKEDLYFCLVPEQQENIKEQMVQFVEECMEVISYKEKANVTFLYGFHSFLKEGNVSLEQMKEYLAEGQEKKESIQEEPMEEESLDWVEELLETNTEEKKKFTWLYVVALFPICLGIGFFSIKIYYEGFVFSNVRNLSIIGIVLGIDLYYIWNHRKQIKCQKETKEPEITSFQEEKTELLTEKTVVLKSQENQYACLIVAGKNGQDIVELNGDEFVIGSQKEAVDYWMYKIGISRKHAKIRWEEGSYRIYDLNSTNGTFVNGERISKDGMFLKNQDKIKIGLEELEFMI